MKNISIFILLLLTHFINAQTTQLRVKVSAGVDDAEVSTRFYTSSSDLELGGYDTDNVGKQYVAVRFRNVALPPTAVVSKAYIQFMAKSATTTTASVSIKCQQGNAAVYAATPSLLTRTYVPTVVTWNPLAWTLANEAGAKQQTPDLSAQINAAIATGWASGNALSFILQGNATANAVLNARSYETVSTRVGAPELVIEYTTNSCSPDIVAPTFANCPASRTISTAGTSATTTWTAPTVSDNCTTGITPSVTSSPTAGLVSGSAFPLGTTTVTYTAKDAANNNAVPCTFTVTVAGSNPCSPDVLPPTITNCPANISLTTTGTTAVATWTVPTITDNCTTNITPSVTTSPTAGLTRGSAFPIGITTVTYNANDAANNSALPCSFTVTVSGGSSSGTTLTIPVSNGNDDVEVSTRFYPSSSDLELGGYDTDNFGKQYVAVRFQNIALPPNAQISKAYIQFTTKSTSVTTANVTIKCQQGNAAAYVSTENLLQRTYVAQSVAWNPPAWTVAAQSGINQQTTSLAAQVQAAIATNWVSGNALSFILQGNATQNNILNARSWETLATHAGAPQLVIEYTIGDPCASDIVAPTFANCPASITVPTTGTTAIATWTAPTVSDNCTTGITPSVTSSPTAGLVSGSAFPLGTTTITYTAKDAANNNAVPCTFTVTVTNPCATDVVAPTFANCPASRTISTAGTSETTTWTAPTVSDNCTTGITPSVTSSPTAGLVSGSAFPLGTTTITYAAKDAANNNAVPCTFTVTVTNPCANDVAPPTFANCPANITVPTTGTSAVATWTAPTVSDNCTTGITPSVTSSPTAGLVSGSTFPLGTTTITYAAKDAANNNALPCTFTVTVAVPNPSTLFINEVSPQGTLAIASDWIELYNDATTAVALTDVYITNKKGTPFKQSLAGLTIPAKGFLILYADNPTTPSLGHLNFKVSAGGEKLYLNRNVAGAAVELSFFDSPPMTFEEDNVTVGGLTEGTPAPAAAALTKFIGGTPGAANGTGLRYLKITNSLPRGIVAGASTVTLTAPAGATIRYTTDNSMPSRTNGTIYSAPIAIATTTVLKVFAYSGNSESKPEAYTYIFPVKGTELLYPNLVTATDYESGLKFLPIISISTTVGVTDSKTEKACTFEYISKFGTNTSAAVVCGVKGYGNDSYLNQIQKNLRLHFKGEYGYGNLEFPIFAKDDVDIANNFTPTNKFDVLDLKIGQDGPAGDGFGMTMTSQGLVSKTMREMGNIDLHTQYVHVYNNGKYHGIYTLKEHWDEHFAETYYGGNKDLYDNIEGWATGNVNLDSDGLPQGTLTSWNALRSAATAFNYQAVKGYLNVKQYTDMMLNMMYFDNEWEFRAFADQSLTATKFVVEDHDTDGALVKTIDGNSYEYDQKWTRASYALILNGPGGIFGNLMRSNNKEFKTLVRDRVYEAFQKPNGALTVARISTKLNELKTALRPAFNMELARFNATFYNDNPYYDEEFDAHIAHLPTRFQYNLDKWLSKGLKHTLLPVTFNQPSGAVTTPVLATNPNANSTMYYTLDGTDPMGNDGVIIAAAKLYSNQLSLNIGTNNVVARPYANGEFGPKTTATYSSTVAFIAEPAIEVAQSVQKPKTVEAFTVYPNPAKDVMEIDLTTVEGQAVSISVFNTMGRTILTEKMNQAMPYKRINIQKLDAGQYFIAIQAEGQSVVMKRFSVIK